MSYMKIKSKSLFYFIIFITAFSFNAFGNYFDSLIDYVISDNIFSENEFQNHVQKHKDLYLIGRDEIAELHNL